MDKRNTGLFVLSSAMAAGERRAYQEGRTQGYKDAQAEMIMDRDERIEELEAALTMIKDAADDTDYDLHTRIATVHKIATNALAREGDE